MYRKTSVVWLAVIGMCGLLATGAIAQVVPGFTVQDYAAMDGPIMMSFDPVGGDLYVGHDLSFSGGTSEDPTQIWQVGPGGSPVNAYGNSVIPDPDAVLWDGMGSYSSVPGTVLVGASVNGFTEGYIYGVYPDQSVNVLYGPSTALANPNDMVFDSTGRLLVLDNEGEVYTVQGGSETLLFSVPTYAGDMAISPSDLVYTSDIDGIVRIHDAAGNLIDDSFVTGLTTGMSAPLAVGPGGSLWGDDLYVIDRDPGELLRIDGAGNATVIGTGFGGLLRQAADMTFGPDGALYVSFMDEGRIIRIIPEPATLALLALGGLALLRRR